MKFNDWNGKPFHEIVDDFIEFINTTKEAYYRDKDVDEEMLKMQNNLIHDLEFDDLNYHGIAKLGKEIRTLRRNRRSYKNEYLLMEPIKDFYKKNPQILDELKDMSEKLKSNAEWINNQHYNQRNTIDGLINMENTTIENETNTLNEDLISLNRVLNKYAINVETKIIKDNINNIIFKSNLQLEGKYSLNRAKSFIIKLGDNIEKFYKPRLSDITCETSTSDMMITDKYKKRTLNGLIKIYCNGMKLYDLQVTIREGKDNKNKKINKRK